MVLNDVANDPGLFIEFSPPFDPERFGESNLDVLHVITVPDWFQEAVGKTKIEDVLHGFFAKIVIDAEDRSLRKYPVQRLVERARRGQIPAKRFLQNYPRLNAVWQGRQLFDHLTKHAGRNGKVVRRPLRSAKLSLQLAEGLRIVVVPVDVTEQGHELVEGRLVVHPGFVHAGPRTGYQLIKPPPRLGDAHDGHAEAPASH